MATIQDALKEQARRRWIEAGGDEASFEAQWPSLRGRLLRRIGKVETAEDLRRRYGSGRP